MRLTNLATNPYMTDPDLASGVLKGAALTMYQVQGTNGYFGACSSVTSQTIKKCFVEHFKPSHSKRETGIDRQIMIKVAKITETIGFCSWTT